MRTLLFFVILAIALFLFNPDTEEFEDFIENKTTEYFQNEAGDSKLGESLAELGGSLSSLLARQVTDRDNYLLFSLYTIDLDGEGNSESEWRFLGIAGQFFEVHHPGDSSD